MSASSLYVGTVGHQRHGARPHRLQYRVFSLLLDLDELPMLDANLRLLSHNRRGLFSILDSDHGWGDGRDIKSFVREKLAKARVDDADGPIGLLCYPRMFGYVFNPLSTYYCFRRDGSVAAMVYEVSNTHGERHCYVIPAEGNERLIRQTCRKEFYVSPFLPMDCEYHFKVRPPGERISIAIHQTRDQEPVLDAWFTGKRMPLSDANLLRVAVQMPLMTLKVILGIHWEAFRLWRKGLPLFSHQASPADSVTLVSKDQI